MSKFLADECTYTETIEFVRKVQFDVIRVQDLKRALFAVDRNK